jgi:hypothetical protein
MELLPPIVFQILKFLALAGFVGGAIFLFLNRQSLGLADAIDTPSVQKKKYAYMKKKFLVTKNENDFYHILIRLIGDEYLVFPQVHLASLLDHEIKGQNWKAALSHIQRKSVDFVLCDKVYLNPLLAIELDDSSHERADRMLRDEEVNAIFKEAGMPLLRVPLLEHQTDESLKQRIVDSLR